LRSSETRQQHRLAATEILPHKANFYKLQKKPAPTGVCQRLSEVKPASGGADMLHCNIALYKPKSFRMVVHAQVVTWTLDIPSLGVGYSNRYDYRLESHFRLRFNAKKIPFPLILRL
jgi:hypothetical protein